jgi:boron transporter
VHNKTNKATITVLDSIILLRLIKLKGLFRLTKATKSKFIASKLVQNQFRVTKPSISRQLGTVLHKGLFNSRTLIKGNLKNSTFSFAPLFSRQCEDRQHILYFKIYFLSTKLYFAMETAFRGIKADLVTRSEHYISDWVDGFNTKVLSSSLFMFFTSMGPAITFSLLLSKETENSLGAIEVLLASCVTGVLFSVFAGQPLVIVGVTGPVLILTVSIYTLSVQWGLNFIPLYGWSQLWAALMIMCLSVFNACDAVMLVTRFSCEIFGILIGMLYLYTGIDGIVLTLGNPKVEFASALLQFIISIGTLYLAYVLSHSTTWNIFTEHSRQLISDYGATLSIVLWSIVPTLANDRLHDGTIPTLFVPLTFETTSGRPWLANLSDIPVWGVFAAIFPGFIIAVLFFFDHNVSSLLAQESEMKLRKGTAFHYDFFIIGVGMVLTGILGIPPTNGLIPQAPLHTKSLIVHKRIMVDGQYTGKYEVDFVHEQRVSNLVQSLLCGVVCFRPFSDALREIPKAVLYGLFLFLGVSSFEGNEFSYRMQLLAMDEHLRNMIEHPYSFVRAVPFAELRKFTLIQMVLCSIIFGITFTEAGVIFPILIALLVFLRMYALPLVVAEADLTHLDSGIINQVECIVIDVDVESDGHGELRVLRTSESSVATGEGEIEGGGCRVREAEEVEGVVGGNLAADHVDGHVEFTETIRTA